MKKIQIGILVLFITIIFILFFITFSSPLKEDTLINIEKNSSGRIVARILYENNVISSERVFLVYLKLSGKSNDIIPGEFLIPKGKNFLGVANFITNPKNIYYHKITLVEGQTVKQFLKLIADNPNLTGEIITVKEGTMMPDTYYFTKGSTRASLINRATDSMDKYLNELWRNRNPNLPFKNKHEALTLAAMVEKETGIASERELIAGLFINRLKMGYKLQSDPTVAYGLGKESAKGLTKTDLTTVHPYNTYTMYGLPKGPIANPSRESLRAVFFPDKTPYLYFVADGKGGHVFTTNLIDHNKEVAKWREIEKNILQKEKAKKSKS
ncbi:MAG: endolytic transglycosylase MltG [Alphaproteobacteria bacterium]|nr:endolytic transglycosylase MltG [Alphaproteobacteria bacterium]